MLRLRLTRPRGRRGVFQSIHSKDFRNGSSLSRYDSRWRRRFAVVHRVCSGTSAVRGQQRSRVPSSSVIPSPKSILGFTPGDDRTIADWRQITDYFARLDKASNRVLVQKIGDSTLRRPIIVAVISAPRIFWR